MNKIEVKVLNSYCGGEAAGTMNFLAKLTQRGHKIESMEDLLKMYRHEIGTNTIDIMKLADKIIKMPHGTIKRFTPYTIAIVGASRRFLAQIRTHHVGLTFVSASLQYSDYSHQAGFVVPYAILERPKYISTFVDKCREDLEFYEGMMEDGFDNDTAGYSMNQALRNVLIVTGNIEALTNVIDTRICRRNTVETQYVAALMWEALYATNDGDMLFPYVGPQCTQRGGCNEGHMSCADHWHAQTTGGTSRNPATNYIQKEWPLIHDTNEAEIIRREAYIVKNEV